LSSSVCGGYPTFNVGYPDCQARNSFGARGRGCITSTPKTAHFAKKQRFWAKYERSSCMPVQKNGERPYPGAPKTVILGLLFWTEYSLSSLP